MKPNILIYLLAFLFATSCIENESSDEFIFRLNENYYVLNGNDTISTPNAFEADNTSEKWLLLTDGEVGQSFGLSVNGCGPKDWEYTINPTTQVIIIFNQDKKLIGSGTYRFDENNQDFFLKLENDMVFEERANGPNILTSTKALAVTYEGTVRNYVKEAVIELVLDGDDLIMDYTIKTNDGLSIVGNWTGPTIFFTYTGLTDCD